MPEKTEKRWYWNLIRRNNPNGQGGVRMKKRILPMSIVLVLACLIVAVYMFVDRSDKKGKTAAVSDTEKLLARDLIGNYPPTPYSVAELYSEIVQQTYNKNITEEQLCALVEMELRLFDPEFAAVNSYDSLLTATKEELAAAAEKKLVFTGYVLDKASNTERWQKEGTDYASVNLQFAVRSKDGSGTVPRTVIFRKDSAGKYRILGWKVGETDEK